MHQEDYRASQVLQDLAGDGRNTPRAKDGCSCSVCFAEDRSWATSVAQVLV